MIEQPTIICFHALNKHEFLSPGNGTWQAAENWAEHRVYVWFLVGKAFQGGLESEGLCSLIFGASSGIGGMFFLLGQGLPSLRLWYWE